MLSARSVNHLRARKKEKEQPFLERSKHQHTVSEHSELCTGQEKVVAANQPKVYHLLHQRESRKQDLVADPTTFLLPLLFHHNSLRRLQHDLQFHNWKKRIKFLASFNALLNISIEQSPHFRISEKIESQIRKCSFAIAGLPAYYAIINQRSNWWFQTEEHIAIL